MIDAAPADAACAGDATPDVFVALVARGRALGERFPKFAVMFERLLTTLSADGLPLRTQEELDRAHAKYTDAAVQCTRVAIVASCVERALDDVRGGAGADRARQGALQQLSGAQALQQLDVLTTGAAAVRAHDDATETRRPSGGAAAAAPATAAAAASAATAVGMTGAAGGSHVQAAPPFVPPLQLPGTSGAASATATAPVASTSPAMHRPSHAGGGGSGGTTAGALSSSTTSLNDVDPLAGFPKPDQLLGVTAAALQRHFLAGRSSAAKPAAQALVPLVEACLQRQFVRVAETCRAVLSAHDDTAALVDGADDDGGALSAEQLGAGAAQLVALRDRLRHAVLEEQAQRAADMAALHSCTLHGAAAQHALLRHGHDVVQRYMRVSGRLVTKRAEALALNLGCMQCAVLCDTYGNETVEALTVARRQLLEQRESCRRRLDALEERLRHAQAVPGLLQCAKRLAEVREKLRSKQWALGELK